MKTEIKQRLIPFCIGLSLACSWSNAADKPQAIGPPPAEQQDYDLIKQRFRTHEDLLTWSSYTLCHCADQKEVKAVEKTLNLFWAFAETNGFTKLIEAGGVQTFKANVAAFLENKDPIVRGYGAILLATIGDPAYKANIARLLADRSGPPPSRAGSLLCNYDRGRAAVALGLMGAREYAPRLSNLLLSPYVKDRVGAALGLGYMGAKEFAPNIAKLLADHENEVKTSAMEALAELGAAEYAKEISARLKEIGTDIQKPASYALARLNAKEHADEIAALLHDRFAKGSASKALALLGAKQYAKDIAALTEDSNPRVRDDAMIALGILDAKEYAPIIATHLRDKKSYVRAYAATALLLMGDQTHANELVNVVLTEWKELFPKIASDNADMAAYFKARIDLHSVVADRQRRLVAQAAKEWARIYRSTNGSKQTGTTNRSQPIR